MLGRYELLSPIGKGGMGNVWAARLRGARGFRKLFAVKTVLNVQDHPRFEQMLFEEATLASQIRHPNVAETIELGEHEGKLYLVMELVDGESLSVILRKAQAEGGMPLVAAVNLVGQICRGLQAAHDLSDEQGNRVGLVHRDISPPNVLVTYSGTVKIIDFGVAITEATRKDENEIKGKVSYFAPEQLRTQPLDARVDVFATGILLYLLTTGQQPFRGRSESETIKRILSSSPVPPPSAFVENYPDALEVVVLRALEKERDQRFPSAAAFLEALESAVPSAFGPAGEKACAEYVQTLLREQMLERRHVLRAAEDCAESSSPRASVLSVPAVVTARIAPARSRRNLGLPFVAVGLTLVASLLTLRNYAWTASRPSAAAQPAVAVARERERVPEPAHSPIAAAQVRARVSEVSLGVAAPPTHPVRPTEPASTKPNAQRSRSQAIEETAATESQPQVPRVTHALLLEPPPGEPKAAPSDSAALAVSSGLGSLSVERAAPSSAPGTPTPAPTPTLAPTQTPSDAPPKLRQVASRVGHSRLAINPLSAPYRIQLPLAIQRTGQTFAAIINICVAGNGTVSSVRFQSSAGPMVDAPLANAVSRWKYRPLLESGHAVPFCYVLRYEFSAR
ncbi:MAG TPA: protein kinase [Polyangiaceae bacterium]|nr:protein kinase [Polyangiaceae bacterium]